MLYDSVIKYAADRCFICVRLVTIIYMNQFQPLGSADETQSMYKEVVLGGDVWDLLDELMIYMKNPMQYYEKEVAFVRVTVRLLF